jgi:hypothetical protein
MIDNFWPTYIDWHLRTEHPWDVALHMEAMSNQIDAFGRTLGEALKPAIDKAAAAMIEFGERIAAGFGKVPA